MSMQCGIIPSAMSMPTTSSDVDALMASVQLCIRNWKLFIEVKFPLAPLDGLTTIVGFGGIRNP